MFPVSDPVYSSSGARDLATSRHHVGKLTSYARADKFCSDMFISCVLGHLRAGYLAEIMKSDRAGAAWGRNIGTVRRQGKGYIHVQTISTLCTNVRKGEVGTHYNA